MALDPTATFPPKGYLRLGRLGRTFQLEGALRLSLDDAVSYDGEGGAAPVGVRALQGARQLFVTGLGAVRLRELFESGGSLMLKLEGVRDRNAAQNLVNATVWVDPAALPGELAAELAAEIEAGDDEERLVGLEVLVDGTRVGEVTGARLDGPNPLVEVTLDAGGARSLLPLEAPYVELTEAGVELTDPPAGLLELG
jgi:ribosomal 30S subunit maturation factor RimM